MRFKGLDLNLLVALDVLLSERNVSRAADRLCLSQSATSGALARLREYFEDELLVQVGRKMVLTPRALTLSGKVRAALMQIDGTILQAPGFDPATVQRELRIMASDYMAIVGLQKALRHINLAAPGLSLGITPPPKTRAMLEQGEVDLLMMPEPYTSPDHPSAHLFEDGYTVVISAENSLYGDTISEEEFYAARHVSARFPTGTPTYETWFMKNRGRERQIAAHAGSFSVMPFLIQKTDRIGLMHTRLARIFAEILPLRLLPCPFDIPPLKERMQWHTYADADDCLRWVREQITATID